MAKAWKGKPPLGVPHVVITHHPPKEWMEPGSIFTFVSDDIEKALEIAKEKANRKDVCINSPSVLQQYLNESLVDVFLGRDIQLFENLHSTPDLECTTVIKSNGVTHLGFKVFN